MKTVIGILSAISICTPLIACELHGGHGRAHVPTATKSELVRVEPTTGSDWHAYATTGENTENALGLVLDVGFRYDQNNDFWFDNTLELTFTFDDAGSGTLLNDVSPTTEGSWTLGKSRGLAWVSKMGYKPFQWQMLGQEVSPYIAVGLGRLSTDFSVSHVPVTVPGNIDTTTRSVGIGF